MFIGFELDSSPGFWYHLSKPIDRRCRGSCIMQYIIFLRKPLRGPSGTRTPSPRYCTPRWRKHSRPHPAVWSVLSDTPSKSPGTVVIWTLCKDFSAILSAIPRENPRIPNSSHLSLTNCPCSSSPARWPISETIKLSLRTSPQTGVAISLLLGEFYFWLADAMKM